MIISFGILSKKLWIPFVFPFFLKFRRIIRNFLDVQDNMTKNIFTKVFINFLSFTLSGLLYLIVIIRTKKRNNNENNPNPNNITVNSFLVIKKNREGNNEIIDLTKEDIVNPIELQKKKIKKKKRKMQFYFIILLTLLQMIAMIIQNIGKEKYEISSEYRQTIGVLVDILFLTIFSMIFLKYSLYCHQNISVLILIICLITFFIQSIIYDNNDFIFIMINIAYYFFSQLFYCLSDVLGKKYLDLFIENIYLFMLKIGIFGLIPILIYDIIIEFFFNDNNNDYHGVIPYIIILFNNPNKIYLLLFDLLFGFIWEVSLWLTIYYFSPCHFIILDALGEFIETIINIFIPGLQKSNIEYNIVQISTFCILYPIVIFFILVFNEIIILNICKLNYNTKHIIMLRQKADGNNCEIDDNGIIIIPLNRESVTNSDETEDDNNNDNESYHY